MLLEQLLACKHAPAPNTQVSQVLQVLLSNMVKQARRAAELVVTFVPMAGEVFARVFLNNVFLLDEHTRSVPDQ